MSRHSATEMPMLACSGETRHPTGLPVSRRSSSTVQGRVPSMDAEAGRIGGSRLKVLEHVGIIARKRAFAPRGKVTSRARVASEARKVLRTTCPMVFLLLVGCVTTKPQQTVLAPRYYGIWVNVIPSYHNWWQISASGAVNYGVALDGGKCAPRLATVRGANQIDVTFGNSGNVYLRLGEGDLLLFEGDSSHFSLHKRVEASDICRKSDGSYFEGAPFPLR